MKLIFIHCVDTVYSGISFKMFLVIYNKHLTFRSEISDLFRHNPSPSYFHNSDKFCVQEAGVAKASLLAPVMASYFIECFNQQAQDSPQKAICWFRYVDNNLLWVTCNGRST
jgi:hypothetical protein